ncbi:hypothetical protein AC1031_009362 [Aphanomyces cochlioides]|nr:hypothetical protein AC1031_009362 [Aphanomyces cochlioides]
MLERPDDRSDPERATLQLAKRLTPRRRWKQVHAKKADPFIIKLCSILWEVYSSIPLDAQGNTVYINRRGKTLLECDNIGEVSFIQTFFFCQMDDKLSGGVTSRDVSRSAVGKHIQQVMASGAEVAFQCTIKSISWKRLDVDFCASPYLDSSGNLVGCILVGTKATPQSSDKLSNEVDIVGQDITHRTAQVFAHFMETSAVQISNCPADEIVGKSFVDAFVPADSQQFVADVLSTVLNGQHIQTFEFLCLVLALIFC